MFDFHHVQWSFNFNFRLLDEYSIIVGTGYERSSGINVGGLRGDDFQIPREQKVGN